MIHVHVEARSLGIRVDVDSQIEPVREGKLPGPTNGARAPGGKCGSRGALCTAGVGVCDVGPCSMGCGRKWRCRYNAEGDSGRGQRELRCVSLRFVLSYQTAATATP